MSNSEGSNRAALLKRWWVAIAGAVLIAVAFGVTGWQLAKAPRPDCSDISIPPTATGVYTDARSIELHGTLCLAVDMRDFAPVATPPDPDQAAIPVPPPTIAAGAEPNAAPPSQPAAAPAARSADDAADYVRIQLYIDGLPAPTPAVYLQRAAGAAADWQSARFDLTAATDASSQDAAAWRAILSGPSEDGVRPVAIGIGPFGAQISVPTTELTTPVDLQVYSPWRAGTAAAGVLLLFGGLVWGGWNSGMLRDGGGSTNTFSLSRSQTLFWLALSFGGFLYIWLVSGQWADVMTPNVLTLIGIAGLSGVSARVLDQSGAPVTPSSGSFFTDVLSDGVSGLSVHRIQLLLWNAVLGAIFVWTAYQSFDFPQFDSNLLVLAGLVNATYLGFKVPENQAALAAANAAALATPSAAPPAPPVPTQPGPT